MTLAVAASLVGTLEPSLVQVAVSGLTVGVAFTVTGATVDGWTWTVQGGNDQPAGASTAVLGDIAAPVGVAFTYTVDQAGTTAASGSVTLTMDSTLDVALVTLDGSAAALAYYDDNADPRSRPRRQASFQVAGRRDEVVRWDVSSRRTGELALETSGAQTGALEELLASGAPLVVKTNGRIRDVDLVRFVQVVSDADQLVGSTNARAWSLAIREIGNPTPSTPLPSSTWDDFDDAYAALTWSSFDSEFASLTWDDFDVTDWANH